MTEVEVFSNYEMRGAFIRGRTYHRIEEEGSIYIHTQCGRRLGKRGGKVTTIDPEENSRLDRCCGNCDWEEVLGDAAP